MDAVGVECLQLFVLHRSWLLARNHRLQTSWVRDAADRGQADCYVRIPHRSVSSLQLPTLYKADLGYLMIFAFAQNITLFFRRRPCHSNRPAQSSVGTARLNLKTYGTGLSALEATNILVKPCVSAEKGPLT